jgi:hypothetical protein
MFIGWPTNIRHHGHHTGQPAYGRRLKCQPDEHNQVYYPGLTFLSPASLSLASLPCTPPPPPSLFTLSPCPRPHRPAPIGAALVAPHLTPADTTPVARAGPWPCPAAPVLPRPGWHLPAGRAPLLGLVMTKALCAR